MTCPNHELLVQHCSGRLDLATAAAIERHLKTCTACSKVRDEQSALWQALDLWEPPPVSSGFDQRLYQRLETGRTQQAWYRRVLRELRWGPTLPVGATAALILAGVLLQVPGAKPDLEPQAIIEVDQVESTLDDLEMLEQFHLLARKEAEPPRSL